MSDDLVERLLKRAEVWEAIGRRHDGYRDVLLVSTLREAAAEITRLTASPVPSASPNSKECAAPK